MSAIGPELDYRLTVARDMFEQSEPASAERVRGAVWQRVVSGGPVDMTDYEFVIYTIAALTLELEKSHTG
jgi:hypothetical protein